MKDTGALFAVRRGVRRWTRARGTSVDAEAQTIRHSEGYASTPWNPPVRGTRPTVDAGGSRPPPSSSRSGDPLLRGNAVRCRYPHATNGGIPARSARMTADFESTCRYPHAPPRSGAHAQPWTWEGRPLLRHPREAGIPPSGAGQCGVVTLVEPFGGFFACCAGSE